MPEMAAAAPEGVFVVPGHPIAGTEFSGPDAGFATLFEKRWTILTPQVRSDPDYTAAVERLATELRTKGVIRVPYLDEDVHDLAGLAEINRYLFATSEERIELAAGRA